MKKVWKWIIGIVVALLVVALVVGGFFMVRSHFLIRGEAFGLGTRGPGMTPFFEGGHGGYGYHMGPGMMGHGFPFGGFFGWLLPVGFVALLVVGVVLLVKAFGKHTAAPQPQVPVSELHCKNCSYTVQAGWRNCPNCGKKL